MTPAARPDGHRSNGAPAGASRRVRPLPSSRAPPHPGQFLQTRFLTPLAISQTDLAAALGISRRRVNEIIRGRRAMTPDTALRLANFFGNDAMFWMQLQVAWAMRTAAKNGAAAKNVAAGNKR